MIRALNCSGVTLGVLLVAGPCLGAPILQQTAAVALPGVNGRIDHLAADLDARRLFVAALGNGSVEVIDVGAGKTVQGLRGFSEPQGVLVIPGSARVVITDGQSDHATIVDAVKLTPVGDAKLPEDSDNVRLETGNGGVWIGAGSGRASRSPGDRARRRQDRPADRPAWASRIVPDRAAGRAHFCECPQRSCHSSAGSTARRSRR